MGILPALPAAAGAAATGAAAAAPVVSGLGSLATGGLTGAGGILAASGFPGAAATALGTAAAAPRIAQGLGNLVQAPAGANLAGNIAATDSMVKAGAQGAMKAGANPSQAAQMGQRLQRLGKALSGSGQGGAAPVQPADHKVSRGNGQKQGGVMSTLPQQSAESPGMQLFNSAPMTPMGGGMPMNAMPMPMNPVQPDMLSGGMYAQPKIDVPQMMPPMPMMRDGGYIRGPGTGRSDSIPARIYQDGRPVQEARLSDGEFVMTESAVRGAGNGDRAKGAARMYRMMREFEKGGRVHGRA